MHVIHYIVLYTTTNNEMGLNSTTKIECIVVQKSDVILFYYILNKTRRYNKNMNYKLK